MVIKPTGLGISALLLAALAGCAAPAEQPAEGGGRLECEIEGYFYFVSHPWACLREGGRVVDTGEASGEWTTVAVTVRWQGRDEIKSGQLHYNRFGRKGEMRLELPAAGDACEGPYTLGTPYEGTWTGRCDSGQTLKVELYLKQYRVAISARGKDGERRTFGFYAPQPGES